MIIAIVMFLQNLNLSSLVVKKILKKIPIVLNMVQEVVYFVVGLLKVKVVQMEIAIYSQKLWQIAMELMEKKKRIKVIEESVQPA